MKPNKNKIPHEAAFKLVAEYAPSEAGCLWNTTHRTGCDTAWAVVEQYTLEEIGEATRDLQLLASGVIPDGWEPHDERIIRHYGVNRFYPDFTNDAPLCRDFITNAWQYLHDERWFIVDCELQDGGWWQVFRYVEVPGSDGKMCAQPMGIFETFRAAADDLRRLVALQGFDEVA